MSEELRVKLLGSPAAFVGEEPVSGFVSVKAQALLFYLAATGETHRRETLASLLWSDVPDAAARKNLRDVLSNLRQLVGPFLLITRQEVGLNPHAPAYIDSQVLSGTLSAVHDMNTGSPANALQSLAEVADPRMGEFLDGFYAPDAPLFEEWMLAERARLQWELGNALERLTEYSLAAGDYAEAETYARRQLEMDSYRETAHRQLMTALALGDRRAEAVAHFEDLADLLRRELGLEPAQKTQELVAKIQAGERITPAFTGSAVAGVPHVPPNNLPEALTPFIGRESELAIIASQLEIENCRLLTLHGPGGAGKTRLALEFVRRRRGQYADGIFFIPLASLTSPENLVFTIANAIDLQIRPGREPRQQLLRFLQDRQILLLLDNFEHLKKGSPLLVDILQGAPQLTILVTSRERLHLSAESLFEVSGLRTDSADDEATEEEPEAVQMFETYARRVRPEFEPDEDERTVVADLCRLVEGMPLAIELAAAFVFALSPAEILQQISAGSRLLESAYADVPPRLRSVRASFNYSWGLLSEEEQQVLMQLAVFRGGYTRESAEAVAGSTAEILISLVDKSMLTYEPTSSRYHIHELIRQLAEERLVESEQMELVYHEHAHFFLSHALRAWQQVGQDRDWNAYYEQIGPELGNCRIALRHALAADDTETALKMATALAEYLIDNGLKEEAVLSLEEVLAEDGERSPAKVRADAYLILSYARTEFGCDREALVEYAEKGLTLYQAIGDQVGVARAFYHCGYAYTGYDWDRARAYLNRSLVAYEGAGIEPAESVALLGVIEILTGNLEEARLLLARRRAIHEKQGHKSGLVRTDTWMANIYYYEGRIDEAQSLAERSLQYRRAHDRIEEDILPPLEVLIHVALHKRQIARARDLLRERLRIMVDNDVYSNAIRCFDEVAEWLFLAGQPRLAAFWLGCFDQAYAWNQTQMEALVIPYYQRLVSKVRNALGEAAYTAAWEEGFTVPVEDALPMALQVVEQTSPESGGCKSPSDREK